MDIKQIAGIAFVILSAASMYVPNLLTRGSVRLTGAELGAEHPERAWVRFVYPFLFILVFFGFAFLFFVSITYFDSYIFAEGDQFFLLGGIMGCIPLMNGIFTLLTGVIPVNRRRQYLYIYDEDLTRTVGFFSIAQGLFFVMAGVIVVLFWS
jgi:hypothetical protein